MFKAKQNKSAANRCISHAIISLGLIFLLIEFFDEFHYGIQSAILPALRSDMGLSYAQVGLLLGLPYVIGTFIEPLLMLLGDTRLRKHLMIAGGLTIVLALFLLASAISFPVVLASFIISFPASGAFVTLSQATLMDFNPGRENQMMARWTVAGSLGNVLGPLVLAGGLALAFGWRWAFAGLGLMAFILTIILLRQSIATQKLINERGAGTNPVGLKWLLQNLWEALRNAHLLRWVLLLQLSDLMLDVFTGYVALYFTDVVGMKAAQASLLLGVLMVSGLIADLVLIPLLERIPGRNVVRISAILAAIIYPAWLLVRWIPAKIALLIMIRFTTIGWYQVLQGEAYAAMPGKSGTVMAVSSLGGIAGGALIWLIGWFAGQAGLNAAMWLLLLGPLSLVLFVPGVDRKRTQDKIAADVTIPSPKDDGFSRHARRNRPR